MRRYLLTVTFSGLAIIANVSAQSVYEKLGDAHFDNFDYTTAVKYYGEAIRKDSTRLSVIQKLATSHRMLNQWSDAEFWYEKVVQNASAQAINKLFYADALRYNRKYDLAAKYYDEYLKVNPADSAAMDKLNGLRNLKTLTPQRSIFHVEHLPLNTPASEFGVAFFKDNNILFSSNRHNYKYAVKRRDNWTNSPFLDIYIAYPDSSGKFKDARRFSSPNEINKRYHEGPMFFLEKENELYFSASNTKKGQAVKGKNDFVYIKLLKVKIDSSGKHIVSKPESAVVFNNDNYSVAHPSISADGKVLFFSSDMPGGYGGTDIYMATRLNNGEWSLPVNLGASINTAYDELFPFFSSDSVLYFASNGRYGLGGLDIYSSKRMRNGWQTPKNLGAPINSNQDDFGLIVDPTNTFGFFVSNRQGGSGNDDIYRFTIGGIKINVTVKDALSREPVGGAIITVYENDKKVWSKKCGKDGTAEFLSSTQKFYTLITSLDGYKNDTTLIHAFNAEMDVEVPMLKLEGYNLAIQVVDAKTKLPIDKAVVSVESDSNSVSLQTFTGGSSFVEVKKSSKYNYKAGKIVSEDSTERYLFVSDSVVTEEVENGLITKKLELLKVKQGVPVIIENIYYDLDKADLRPESKTELDKLVKIMSDNPTMQIELSSHTDCRASTRYNLELSARRAESVVNYLISKGIDSKRMLAVGYGEEVPVVQCKCSGQSVSNCTEEQHQQNRRTEFKVLKF